MAAVDGLAYRFVKRSFDIVFSGVVTAVLVVPVAALGIAISLESPGGPMFRQARVGKNGKQIRIFKLRSMYADAHEHPERYLSEEQLAQWRREQKVDNDPRVTRIGRLLRKTSLDELPQFLNVLIGDMSVVGPRPVTEEETYEFGADRDLALSVRPGITGLWQVTARNDATWESGERQRLELEYVRNRSIGMDLRIVLATFGAVLKKTGK
ncbi:sugar transferase [Thermophilibacter provencensis]|uniref:Sugar transferase n=1 Tax=Thermophilibacter provencensis TaxID=1852386 RepID=A0ABT7V4Q3_9ACTN|nr:sugar transferase [Thermophilibacter provencensis]MDM8271587.1 sugar transferase [Thermophilibacter provencensis]